MTEIDNNLPRGAAVLTDRVIPARAPWSGHVRQGDILRLIDLEGRQAIDFLCYNADDPEERYHAPNTIKIPGNVYLNTDSVLYSVHARAMMTIVADTCGNHDTIFGCCSFALDKVRYGQTNSECCQRTFERELAKHGLGAKDVVPNVNFFMNVPIRSGGNVSIEEGQSRPGDHVDLRADMDVLVILSNCPEALNAASGSEPTPIRVVVYRPRGS